MDSTERVVLVCGSVVFCVVVISISWSMSLYYTTIAKLAIESGYEQRAIEGHSGAYWVKVK